MRIAFTLAALLVGAAFAQAQAWRDLNFGMTHSEYLETLNTYGDVSDSSYGGVSVLLGGTPYELEPVWPDNLLGRLQFTGPDVTVLDFARLLAYQQDLVSSITTTAGVTPEESNVSKYTDVPYPGTWTHVWPVSDDGVLRRIGIEVHTIIEQDRSGREVYNLNYRAVLWVEDAARMAAWEER